MGALIEAQKRRQREEAYCNALCAYRSLILYLSQSDGDTAISTVFARHIQALMYLTAQNDLGYKPDITQYVSE